MIQNDSMGLKHNINNLNMILFQPPRVKYTSQAFKFIEKMFFEKSLNSLSQAKANLFPHIFILRNPHNNFQKLIPDQAIPRIKNLAFDTLHKYSVPIDAKVCDPIQVIENFALIKQIRQNIGSDGRDFIIRVAWKDFEGIFNKLVISF